MLIGKTGGISRTVASWPQRFIAPAVFALAIGVMLLASAQTYVGMRELASSHREVGQSLRVLLWVRRTQAGLLSAESAARGFALTREPGDIASLEAAQAALPSLLEPLGQLIAGSAEQRERLARVEASLARQATALRGLVQASGAETVAALRAQQAAMVGIQAQLEEMVRAERGLYDASTAAAEGEAGRLTGFLLVTVVVSVAILTVIYLLMRREVSVRRRKEHQIAELNASLDERVRHRTSELERARRELEREMSERARATETLQVTKEMLETILACSPMAIVGFDENRRVIGWNHRAEELFERSAADVMGQRFAPFARADASRFATLFEHVLGGRSFRGEQFLARRGEEGTREVRVSAAPLFDQAGQAHGAVLAVEDFSERRLLEDQLRQAQKMEAVGQLTGGMAHDFNNLLAVIIGNLDLAGEARDLDEAREAIDEALDAAQRGAELTRRLLAFARRQPLQPRAVDVSELARGLRGLLQRTLGESITIETRLGENLPPALADAAQLEAAILNLAVNARDAMPRGGKLMIETREHELDDDYAAVHREVVPGRYLLITVADNGSGMSPEVLARAFEPFFTTKGPGRGSGLGLSMIFGFAKQSGGHVSLYSEEGLGTTARIYLPLAAPAAAETVGEGAREELRGRGETILAVEDQPEVRRIVVRQLTHLGYRVLEAGSAEEALNLLWAEDRVDLLFTDIVMAGMSGTELAEMARRARPGLRVLLTSGFADSFTGAAQLGQAEAVLTKPYRRPDLARRLRTLLDDGTQP